MNDYGGYGWKPTEAWLATEFALVCGYLNSFADVIIGVDLNVEANVYGYTTPYPGPYLYRVCKQAGPLLKYTWSVPNEAGLLVGLPGTGYDFIEVHSYSTSATTSQFDTYMSTHGVPCLIGEFGQNMAAGSTARQTEYTNILNCVNYSTSGRQVAGAHVWSMCPQDTPGGSNDYGLCSYANPTNNATITERSDVSSIFASFPS